MSTQLQQGIRFHEQGRYQEAEACYQEALQMNPSEAEAMYGLARVYQAKGDFSRALQHIGKALEYCPRSRSYLLTLAHLLFLTRCFADIPSVIGMISGSQSDYECCLVLGACHYEQGDFSAAKTFLGNSLQMKPDCEQSLLTLSNIAQREGRMEEAREKLLKVLSLNPQNPDGLNNFGALQLLEGLYEEAYRKFQLALKYEPGMLAAQKHLATVCQYLGKPEEAMEHMLRYLQANGQDHDAAAVYGQMLLSKGDWNLGWDFYRIRTSMRGGGRFLERDVRGPLRFDGKVLNILTDQGIGDELFFSRFVPYLKELGAREVHFVTRSKGAKLLERSGLYDSVSAQGARVADQNHYVADLPYILRYSVSNMTPESFRLQPLPEKLKEARELLGEGVLVGLSWRAGTGDQDPFAPFRALSKSIPLEDLAKGLKGFPVKWVSLQRNSYPGETESLKKQLDADVLDLSKANQDLELMLAVLSCLHLYAGVSNTNHHLMECLGKNAVILANNPPEFRQMATGEVSPWYPNFRIFRQGSQNWGKAAKSLRKYLEESLG